MEPSKKHPYDFWNLQYLPYPSSEWFRFRLLCKRELLRMMLSDCPDSDFETMLRLVTECNTPESVWKLICEYNETYFREVIQSIEEAAKHEFINFTNLPGLQLPGPWTRSRTKALSQGY